MILELLIGISAGVLNWLISLFPNTDASVTSAINANWTTFRSWSILGSWLFPINTLLTCFGVVFIIEGSFLTIGTLKYIYNFIRHGASL